MALEKPRLDSLGSKPRPREAARDLRRWIIPIGGGLLAASLIVLSTPHVPWYLRLALGVIAFVYVSGQSAAYLWSGDQGH